MVRNGRVADCRNWAATGHRGTLALQHTHSALLTLSGGKEGWLAGRGSPKRGRVGAAGCRAELRGSRTGVGCRASVCRCLPACPVCLLFTQRAQGPGKAREGKAREGHTSPTAQHNQIRRIVPTPKRSLSDSPVQCFSTFSPSWPATQPATMPETTSLNVCLAWSKRQTTVS